MTNKFWATVMVVACSLVIGCTPVVGVLEKHIQADSDVLGVYIQGWGPGFGAAGRGVIMMGKADQNCQCTVAVTPDGIVIYRPGDWKENSMVPATNGSPGGF